MLWFHRGKRSLPNPVPRAYSNRHLTNGRSQPIGAVAHGPAEHDAGGDGGVTTKGDFRLGTEVTNGMCSPRSGSHEGGFGIADFSGDSLHDTGLGKRVPDPHAGGIAALGIAGKGRQPMQCSGSHDLLLTKVS